MTDEEFARERLGIWREDDGPPSVISAFDWAAGEVPAVPGQRLVLPPLSFGVEVTPDREWASIGAAGDTEAGKVAVYAAWHGQRDSGLLDRVHRLWVEASPKALVIDPKGPAGSLVQPLEELGVTVTPVTVSEYARACAGLYDDIVGRQVVHPRRTGPAAEYDAALDAAVATATKRPYSDVWLWDRRGSTPATPLSSVTLARYGHLLPIEEDDDGEDFAIVV